MTSITTNVKHRVRTTGVEHQGQNSISDHDQKLKFTCIFSSGVQEVPKLLQKFPQASCVSSLLYKKYKIIVIANVQKREGMLIVGYR